MSRAAWAELIGFCALAISLCGHALAANRMALGWRVRAAAGPFWFTTALLTGVKAYIVTATLYLCLDCFGAWRRRKKDSN